MSFHRKITEYTQQLNQKGLLRIRELSNSQDADFLCFDSNDYLSLTRHKVLAEAYQKGYQQLPCGSGGSMFLGGYHQSHQAFEQSLATWLEVDECVLYSSGYAANLAVTGLLGRLNAHCLIDKGVHASIYDGMKLAQVSYTRFVHNDLQDASQKLISSPEYSILMTEGIFSMSGQMSPLAQMSSLCIENQAELLVDEAHSFGVIGAEGKGAVNQHCLQQREVPLRVIPLGKAFASQGAIVAGQGIWIDALLQAGRSLTYSTAMSPAMSYGLLKTLDVVAGADDRRLKLQALIQHFRACIKTSSLVWIDSSTCIQQVQLGCPHLALLFAQELKKRGISCSAIRQPTVTAKESGLRIILNYHHQSEQIDRLFSQLERIYENTSG